MCHWLLHGHASCAPYCASPVESQFLLRTLDEVLQALQATVEEQTTAPPAPITATWQCQAVPSDSDCDFDLPFYCRYASQQFVTLPVVL